MDGPLHAAPASEENRQDFDALEIKNDTVQNSKKDVCSDQSDHASIATRRETDKRPICVVGRQ